MRLVKGRLLFGNCALDAPILWRMSYERQQIIDWLRAILSSKGWKPTELARRAKLAPSTINRFMNSPDADHVMSTRSLQAIANVAGVAVLQMPGMPRPPGFGEADALAWSDNGSGDAIVDHAVKALIGGRNNIDPWVMRSRALEHAGYLPGDVLLIDLNETPRPKDAVCAQVYDWSTGKAETIMRLYEPPFLVAASSEPKFLKPFIVDDHQIVIKGVIVSALHPRRARAAA